MKTIDRIAKISPFSHTVDNGQTVTSVTLPEPVAQTLSDREMNTMDDQDKPKNDDALRAQPGIRTASDGSVQISCGEPDMLRTLFGTQTNEAASGILVSAINALGRGGERHRPFVGAMAAEMEPKDAVDAMLVAQMAVTHIAMTSMSQRMADAPTSTMRESFERSMTRLSRTYIAQMEALKKYRAKAQQVVRVERVTVHDGGQAVVGPVTHGGRADHEK